MTSPADDSPGNREQTEQRMRAIAAELTAAGLNAHVYQTSGVLDIAATLSRAGRKDSHVIIDEDGYVELRYWNDPAATPAQIAATITRALSVITTPAVTAPG
jgi:hypothetical protein